MVPTVCPRADGAATAAGGSGWPRTPARCRGAQPVSPPALAGPCHRPPPAAAAGGGGGRAAGASAGLGHRRGGRGGRGARGGHGPRGGAGDRRGAAGGAPRGPPGGALLPAVGTRAARSRGRRPPRPLFLCRLSRVPLSPVSLCPCPPCSLCTHSTSPPRALRFPLCPITSPCVPRCPLSPPCPPCSLFHHAALCLPVPPLSLSPPRPAVQPSPSYTQAVGRLPHGCPPGLAWVVTGLNGDSGRFTHEHGRTLFSHSGPQMAAALPPGVPQDQAGI